MPEKKNKVWNNLSTSKNNNNNIIIPDLSLHISLPNPNTTTINSAPSSFCTAINNNNNELLEGDSSSSSFFALKSHSDDTTNNNILSLSNNHHHHPIIIPTSSSSTSEAESPWKKKSSRDYISVSSSSSQGLFNLRPLNNNNNNKPYPHDYSLYPLHHHHQFINGITLENLRPHHHHHQFHQYLNHQHQQHHHQFGVSSFSDFSSSSGGFARSRIISPRLLHSGKRNMRAPRMRWTSSLHARFVHAVQLLGGHESKYIHTYLLIT